MTIQLSVTALIFALLYLILPYNEGYGFTRSITILSNVTHGYTLDNSEWGFGYLVLPITIVMLWLTKDRFQGLEVKPSYSGLAIIIFSFLLYYAGFKANQKYMGFASGQMIIAGFTVYYLGWKYFWRGFWLWCFFGLVWPWIPFIDYISFPLRNISTELSVRIWNVFGGDALKQGTALVSAAGDGLAQGERFNLQVAAACSGLRSLFALFMISLLFAYLGVKETKHRIMLVIAMFPVAVMGNAVRIMLLLIGTIWWGKDFAVGKGEHDPSAYHLGAGFVVYFIALACMFLLVALMRGGFKVLLPKKKKVIVVKKGNVSE